MSTSARRQVAVIWAVLFACAAIVDVWRGHDRPDDASFRAGYSAVSDAAHDVAPMAPVGANSQSVCDALLDRRLAAAGSNQLIAQDFVNGCRRAIAEAAE